MEILITVAFMLPRLIWSSVKIALLVLLVNHIVTIELTYATFHHFDITISGLLKAIRAFVSENWVALSSVGILYYSWSNSRAIKMMSKRIEQIEVSAFTQLNYFDFKPVRDIERENRPSLWILDILSGPIFDLFNLYSPFNSPWSARPMRAGSEVSISTDIRRGIDKNA